MRQFEELWEAASTSGVASRPLPLFYALNQAGRAISAAHYPASDFRLRGHGVHWPSSNNGLQFFDAKVELKSRGAFPTVVQAVNSSPLSGSAEIGALWYCLPELAGCYPTGSTIRWSRAMPANYQPQSGRFHFKITKVDDQPIINLEWEADGDAESDRLARFENIAIPYFRRNQRWIMPGIPQANGATSIAPLRAWWALLCEFSSWRDMSPMNGSGICVSTWLKAGVPAPQVAEWAGHSVEVLLRVYAKCIDGQDETARRRITEAREEG